MIPRDWTNMTQAVWMSPLLPLLPTSPDSSTLQNSPNVSAPAIGTGARFKSDLLSYLTISNYGPSKTGPLITELRRYDFSSIRAALVASVPSQQDIESLSPSSNTVQWGWPRLRQVLSCIPTTSSTTTAPEIVIQISSIASLGVTSTYLD